MIQHIFVVDNSGIPVFSRCIMHTCSLGQLDAFAVSGLLTALKSFAKEIGVGDINAIDVAESKLLIRNEEKFFSTFQLDLNDKMPKFETQLLQFSGYLSTIYPSTPPIDQQSRNIIVNHIEKYLADNLILEHSGIFSKLKAFLRRLIH